MRIGIDCRTILDEKARHKAGVAHYTYYLVKTLLEIDRVNEYVLFFDERSKDVAEVFRPPPNGNLPARSSLRHQALAGGKVSVTFFRYSAYKNFLPYIYSHIFVANQIKKAQLDVYHSPANIVPMALLRDKNRPKLVVTIHDLAIYHHPAWFPPRQGFSIKYLVPRTVKGVERIVVPSLATKQDVMRFFGVPEGKITVIPHGVEERFFATNIHEYRESAAGRRASINKYQPQRYSSIFIDTHRYSLSKKYILFVGTIEPRKNLKRLIQAYASLPEDILARYDLVIAGQKGWKYEKVFLEIRNLKLEIRNKIKILGFYPGEGLPFLMQSAAVFVYPSLYEGFGLPVLEAMAAGVPVVTSDISSLPELVTSPVVRPSALWRTDGRPSPTSERGRGEVHTSAILVNPYSVEEISAAITKLIRDGAYSSQISKVAQSRAREFTWEKAARETLKVYESLRVRC